MKKIQFHEVNYKRKKGREELLLGVLFLATWLLMTWSWWNARKSLRIAEQVIALKDRQIEEINSQYSMTWIMDESCYNQFESFEEVYLVIQKGK